MKQVLIIFSSMLLGIIFYQGYHFTFIIRYTVMLMLFLAFINIAFNLKVIHPKHLAIVLANVALPVIIFYLIKNIDFNLALTCFTVAITPTAAGAPIMASFLKVKVEFVTASVILTTPIVAIAIPLILPMIIQVEQEINTLEVLLPTATLVFIPLILSQLIRNYAQPLLPYLFKLNKLPFYLFVGNIFIASGKASHFIQFETEEPWSKLLIIALGISLIGFFLFKIGEWLIGRNSLQWECGLALGRKNTMFALWVALTFINPLVALGPIFYILFHNIYNSFQLYSLNKKKH